MSVEKDFEKTPSDKYRTSKKIISVLNRLSDLVLVTPTEYNEDLSVSSAYKILDGELVTTQGRHVPHGDLFITYGDETSKNLGLGFARMQYDYLSRLEESGSFTQFFNKSEVEERTMKENLINLRAQFGDVFAQTYKVEDERQIQELFNKHGSLIAKPIFGCASAGVKKINNMSDFYQNELNEKINDYVFQEPLNGLETRVIVLGGEYLGSRQDLHYEPWSEKKPSTKIGSPSVQMIDFTKDLAENMGADILGVDFMDDKVYEINGTGTGLIAYNDNELLFDYTPQFVDYVEKKMGGF